MVKFRHGRNTLRLKAFTRNFSILNTILLLITVFFILYIFLPRLETHIQYKLPAIRASQEKAREDTLASDRTPSITEYAIVSEKNLFNPDRIIPVEKKIGQEQPLSKPEFLLYGILISNDVKLAYLEDLKAPRNTPGRGKRQVALKIGDTLSGFTLKEIHADSIVMTRGKETFTIKVSENEDKKQRNIQPAPKSTPPPVSRPARKPRNIRQERLRR
jgi:type II secretory pathway component PulC